MTSTFDKVISLGTDYLYVTRGSTLGGSSINSVGRWNGNAGTIESVDSGVDGFGLAILAGSSTSDVYVGGTMTLAGGSLAVNKIAYFNGTEWTNLNSASVFDNNVTSLAYDSTNNILYAASHQTSTVGNRISMWNGTAWTGIAESTINNYVKMDIDSDGNLYIGYGSVFKKRIHSSGAWETISSSIGGTITDLKYNTVNNRIYIVIYASSNNIKYYDVQSYSITTLPTVTSYPRGVAFNSNNDVFVGVQSPSIYQGSIQKYNSSSELWENLFNYQSVSGILDIEIDANDNIFCYANAGSLTVGVSPYQNGDWEPFSNSTSVSYGGPSQSIAVSPEEEAPGMGLKVGDSVCLVEYPAQQGVVIRLNPLKVKNAAVIKWTSGGPMYQMNNLRAYFTNELQKLELM